MAVAQVRLEPTENVTSAAYPTVCAISAGDITADRTAFGGHVTLGPDGMIFWNGDGRATMKILTAASRPAPLSTCTYCGNGSAEKGNPSKCATCGGPLGGGA